MELKVITEDELRRALGAWMLDNSRTEFIPEGQSREDYLEAFRLPRAEYVHTQTCLDSNGDAVTTLKATIKLKDWQTKGGKADAVFVYYMILKTLTARPNAEAEVVGYIVV